MDTVARDSLQEDPGALVAHVLTHLPGSKILTVVGREIFSIDLGPEHQIGYERRHRKLLLAAIGQAMAHGGGVIVRQFLAVRTERVMPNGKKLWIPEKNLYGATLGEGKWILMPGQFTQEAHLTDAATGQRLEKEPGTHFPDWPAATQVRMDNFPVQWRCD